MAFYTEERLNENRVLTDADFNVGFTDYLGATISDAWHDNPTVATIELGEVFTAQVGRDAIADIMGDSFDTETDVSEFEPTASPALSLEDQQAIIRENGLEKHIKAQEGYNTEALNLVMESKREELERQVTRQAASDWYAPAGFIAGLGTSFLDPINVASNFIPGVGQTRALRMLQEGAKQGAKGLALRRAAIGAAEGAVGSVVVEPLVAFARSQQQADYGMTDSLLNVAFGTVMGATLHPALGAWGDYKRRQAQKNNPLITEPWETVAPTDKTEELRFNMVQNVMRAVREAGADISEEQAYAAAALFDARARTVAYTDNIAVEDYYDRWRASFLAGASGDSFIAPDLAEGIGADLDPASRPNEPVQEVPVEVPAVSSEPIIQPVPGRWRGSSVSVLTPQGEDRGYYELRELSDIITSHDPDSDFSRRADYPEGAQERPYHSDQNEKDKVFRNAMTLDPRYLVNDNPDAVNGPPVITENGVVLGGNSRTMSIQLAYGRYADRAELYKQALRDKAALFGIDASAVDNMTAPVLVRVVEGLDTPEAMALRSRLYNQSMTQGINRGAEGVSRGRLVSPDSINILASGMEEGETLRSWLDTADGKRFVQSLINDGVLEQTQLGRLLDENGALTDEGKALVEKTLRGLIVPDADLLRITAPSVLNKLDGIVPAVLRLKARGEGWDISKHLAEALEKLAEAQNMDVGLDILFGQGSLLSEQGAKPAVQAIAYTLKNATPTETKLRFNLFAEAAYKAEKGQGSLLASGPTPADGFIRSFLGSVAKVGDKGIADFNPAGRIRDKAILYAWENGGKGHSIETATQRLAEAMRKGEVGEELKESAHAIMGQLANMEGSVQVFGPKMGERFRYAGGALFQAARAGVPDAVAYLSEDEARMMKLPGGGDFIARASDLEPVDRKHGTHFKDNGFANALEMVRFVLDDVQAVYKAGGNAYFFVRPLTDRPGAVVAEFEIVPGENRYRVTTAHPVRTNYFKNKTPLWEGARLNRSEEPLAHISGQSGVSEANIPQTDGDINTLLQRAWHGTPHNFDAFTLQAIGTGEGAQAHGWGLYFAERKRTAEKYRKGLSAPNIVLSVEGKKYRWKIKDDWESYWVNTETGIPAEDFEQDHLSRMLRKAEGDAREDDYLSAVEEWLQDENLTEEQRGHLLRQREEYLNSEAKLEGQGQLFELEIPDNDVLLDEQKVFEEQPEKVKEGLFLLREKAKKRVAELEAKIEEARKNASDSFEVELLEALLATQKAFLAKGFEGKTGREIYHELQWPLGSPRAASEVLNAVGVKGITYDGRRDGRCFVVFDDAAIEVIDKLYQIIGEKGAARLDRAREETVRTDNLAVAVKMAAEGKDDITIRLATGWEQGVDGKWRYEIPDGRLDFSGLKGKVKPDRYTPKGAHRSARLKDVLIMPDLYAAYPEIADIRVFTQTLPRQEAAAVQVYSDGTKVIVLNSRYAKPGKPTDEILSNIVHEVQHVIQSAEGFIQGSNPKKAGGVDRYMEVAGEAEARNAEGRMGFTPEERNTFLLSATSDVPAGNMRTPDGKPLRDPRLPVEPVGPLIGREPRHALPEELPDDYDLDLPPEMPDAETPRGKVEFNPNDGKAVVTFFKNADASTLPHEMFHLFRRELADTASREGASPQSKDMWARVCEFVGAKGGEKWTVEQEEMFARAGERYLLEGKAPNVQLRGVFERMKQWFMEIYTSVDAAGLEISDTMRQVFGDMFRLSPEEADMAFRYGFGRMLEWDPSEGTETALPEMQESDDPALQEELNGLAQQGLEESLQSLADMPEVSEAVRAEIEQELAVLDEAMTQDKIQGEVLLEAALCDMRN